MANKKLSIITAVYNGAQTIGNMFDSIRDQYTNEVELIIIDAGSSDNTVDLIKANNDIVSYWCSEPDDGIYDAWNKGVAASSGEIITFLSSDDYLARGAVSKILSAFRGSNLDALFGSIKLIRLRRPDLIKHSSFALMTKRMSLCHPAVYLRRKFLEEHPFDKNFKIAGDYEFCLWLYHAYPKLFHRSVRTVFVEMREGGVSDQVKGFKTLIFENYRIRKRYQGFFIAFRKLLLDLAVKFPRKVIVRAIWG